VTIVIDQYYDSACTSLWFVGNLIATEPNASTLTLTGSYTYYTTAGAVYEYASPTTLTVTETSSTSVTVSLETTVAANSTSAPLGTVGVGCSIVTSSAACSVAAVAHEAATSADDGVALNVSATVGSATAAGTPVTISGSGSAAIGSLDSISVIAQGTYGFGISGGAIVDTATDAGTLTVSPTGTIAGGTFTVTDAADGGTLTATDNPATQTLTGTLVQTSTGVTIATYTVNTTTGSGTLTYSNGSTGTITGWNVVS